MSDKKQVIIALGYFDSVHKGHVKVINTAISKAKEQGVSPAVFTFKGDLKKALNLPEDKCVFTYKEREKIIRSLGVKEIFFAPTDKNFIGKTKVEFLDYLNDIYSIKGYVCGEDYTFGRDRGDIMFLQDYAKANNQTLNVVNLMEMGGKKIATTEIKEMLKNGNVCLANQNLYQSYFVTGRVFHDRKVGALMGVPTANVKINKDKYPLKPGVYAGQLTVNGNTYKAVVNYGARPTFKLKNQLIEAHIINFNQDIYGKTVKIEFNDYIREIKEFSSKEELIKRIEQDISIAKEKVYD